MRLKSLNSNLCLSFNLVSDIRMMSWDNVVVNPSNSKRLRLLMMELTLIAAILRLIQFIGVNDTDWA